MADVSFNEPPGPPPQIPAERKQALSNAPESRPNPRPAGSEYKEAPSQHPVFQSGGETPSIPPEQANRIVVIHPGHDQTQVIGVGCLVDQTHVLTSREVLQKALPSGQLMEGAIILMSTTGQAISSGFPAKVVILGSGLGPGYDLALLELLQPASWLDAVAAEFATPMKYDAKAFVVMTFASTPGKGFLDRGQFVGAHTDGTTRMGTYKADAFFGGAPVWSPELEAFVGLVHGLDPTTCINSARLCEFYPDLAVKFRIPPSDKPEIRDYSVDDPNAELFGQNSENNQRRLTATMRSRRDGYYSVKLSYEVFPNSPPPRGRFVTFITYPDMDEYEIFAELDSSGKAEVECRPLVPDFTVAAIGDGGDTRLTLNLETLRSSESTENANPEAYSQIDPLKHLSSKEQTETEDAQSGVEAGYRSTYAAFENDLVAFDARSFRAPLKDALNNRTYARHLAQLIVAQRTPLPLSLGLFGDWGSGKSYFMRLLHEEIEALSLKGDRKVFCPKVVQIHFNAWHYLDTNLWANLVCEIFDNLFNALIERPDTPNDKVEALKKKLAEESALAAEAKKALEAAKKAREEAETKLKEAALKREEQEKTVAAFIDDLKQVAADAGLQTELKKLADGFGLSRLGESFAELEARAMEARSLAGRFRSLGLALLSPEGRWQRLGLLFAALVIPVLLALLLPQILGMQDQLAEFTRSVTASVTLLGTVAAWISTQTKRGTDLLQKLETTYDRVKKAREEVRKDKKPTEERLKLDERIKEEAEAQHAVIEAQTKVRAIESELRELAPGRRLLKFLEQRSGANDYRQYLGLVSLVRRDFEQLSRLLQEGNEFKEDGQPMLDRIVLYVDDLDRCKSDRVIEVLEAVHLLLAFPIFAVVVAVDPRWLRKSLIEHYPTLLANGRAAKGGSAIESRESLASPQDYLEKIFQVPFQLERIEKDGFTKLVIDLVPIEKAPEKVSTQIATNVVASENENTPSHPMEDPGVKTVGSQSTVSPASAPPASPSDVNPVAPTPTVTQRIESGKEGPAEPPPAIPERLQLEEWERAALQMCYPLFRTPRGVKRLVNTYCLIRTGVEAADWKQFMGSRAIQTAEYRTPLLMLAVAAAYPGLARQWLDGLETAKGWKPAHAPNSPVNQAKDKGAQADWDDLAAALESMKPDEFAHFDVYRVRNWLPRVKRYSF